MNSRFLIVRTPSKRPLISSPNSRRKALSAEYLRHPGIEDSIWYLFSYEGITLLDSWNIQQLQLSKICASPNNSLLNVVGNKLFQPHIPFFSTDKLRRILQGARGIGWSRIQGYRVIIDRRFLNTLSPKFVDLQRRPGNEWREEWAKDSWTMIKRGDCPPLKLSLDKVPSEQSDYKSSFLAIAYPSETVSSSGSLLAETWREVIDLPYIPYDIVKRRDQLARAYNQLASYIHAWEEIGK